MKAEKIFYKANHPLSKDRLVKQVQDNLKLGLLEFTRIETSQTATFTYDNACIEILPDTNDLSGKGASFIREVKDAFSSKIIPERLSDNRPYCEYFRPISTYTEVENLCEVDINKAYWQAALNLGYLHEWLYKKALSEDVNKKARLIALGTLGKKTVTTEFKPPYKDVDPIEELAKTRPFWDNIVFTVGKTLEKAVDRYLPHIYGVWFDAIFIESKMAQPLRKYLQRNGFDASTESLQSYLIEPRESIRPGARITRVFKNGAVKYMDVSYLKPEDRVITFDQFIKKVVSSM
jgi:hypothetical protein